MNYDIAFQEPTGCLIHRNPAMGTFAIFDTKLIIGFDFATTRSSSPGFPCCCLFDVILRFLIDLRWLQEQKEKVIVLNKRRKWVSFITSEVAFGQQVIKFVSWCQHIEIFDSGVQVDSVKQSIWRDSVGSGHASHRRTSACNNHLDHCLSLFKNKSTKHRSGRVVRL